MTGECRRGLIASSAYRHIGQTCFWRFLRFARLLDVGQRLEHGFRVVTGHHAFLIVPEACRTDFDHRLDLREAEFVGVNIFIRRIVGTATVPVEASPSPQS